MPWFAHGLQTQNWDATCTTVRHLRVTRYNAFRVGRNCCWIRARDCSGFSQVPCTMLDRRLLEAEEGPPASGATDDQIADLDTFFVLLSGYLVRARLMVVLMSAGACSFTRQAQVQQAAIRPR